MSTRPLYIPEKVSGQLDSTAPPNGATIRTMKSRSYYARPSIECGEALPTRLKSLARVFDRL